MATPQLSPGVLIREVDLTVGRAENVLDNIGGIAGPFRIGPIDDPIRITTEQELINTFGKPMSTDRQYEYWLTASSFLSYGGVLKVVRTDGTTLNNANAGVSIAGTTSLKIKNEDDYEANYTDATAWFWAAKNPGTWANTMKVCFIDNVADQTIGITTDDVGNAGGQLGYGVTTLLSNVSVPGAGSTSGFTGYLQGIITGINTDSVGSNSTIDVKITNRVEVGVGVATINDITYAESDPGKAFEASDTIFFVNNSGVNTGGGTYDTAGFTATTVEDWYDNQNLGLTNSTVYWKSIAQKPTTSNYCLQRKSKNDAMHVVIVDDTGDVTGIQGSILEKHTFLSKAKDTVADGNAPAKTYYKTFLQTASEEIYAGYSLAEGNNAIWSTTVHPGGFSTDFTAVTVGDGLWGQEAQGVTFSSIGNKTFNLTAGVDYSASKGMAASLGDLLTSYNEFAVKEDEEVDYLVMGPGLTSEDQSQAKANLLISIAEGRKDCMATISPHRANLVGETNTTTQTDNLLKYYSPITSSSYAVLDTGWKYMYDRFNNEFRWIPTNGDIAGLMVRTAIERYPWFSPAGQQRGNINFAIKMAYNPSKDQRDVLYSSRINAIINQKGSGIILYGDKTALSYSSAFDRINVRRLFLTVEQALEGAANAQLFELNDNNTRAAFVNIVEPYLRDVQAKRGVYDFLVVCDESNNTPDVIDNNEFRADIYLKPTKSINYVTLTFVATKTGVDFSEVVGTV